MKKIIHIAYFVFLSLIFAACTSFPYNPPSPTTPTPEEESAAAATTAPETPAPQDEASQTLRIWLPPEFDPVAETDAGALLRARLDEFEKRRPGLNVEVRIKAPEGQASLLNALNAASQAAPSTLPDLIALTSPDLEAATLQGLLHPIDGLTTLIDDPDWFSYARELAHIQNTAYGLPFAGDTLAFLYRPNPENLSAPNWEMLQEQEIQLIFPADNPQSDLGLCLYNAMGGSFINEQGQPTLDEEPLTELLTFYQSEFISPAVTQYQSDEQVWEAYRLQDSTVAIIWASRYLDEMPADSALAPIPGLEAESCSLATAWIWALAGSNPDLQPVAVELAEFLSDSDFLAAWTASAGYLPPRPTALDSAQTALHEISLVAQPIPSNEIRLTLGTIFRDAALSVVQEHASPSAVAQSALESLE